MFLTLKSFLYANVSLLASAIAFVVYKRCKLQRSTDVNEVLFYGDGPKKRKVQIIYENIQCIGYVIFLSSRSLDVCIANFTNGTLAKVLIKLHQKKTSVTVRVIANEKYDGGSQLFELAWAGIPVKTVTGDQRVEHEFILVDALESFEDAVAITGALNHDLDHCPHDSTILTSDVIFVKGLKMEFERMWNLNENAMEEFDYVVIKNDQDEDNTSESALKIEEIGRKYF